MKDEKNKQKKKLDSKIIMLIIILVLIILIIIQNINRKEQELKSMPVDYETVETLFKEHTEDSCTEFSRVNQETSVEDAPQKALLYLVFGQLKSDGVLDTTISIKDYKNSALKVLNKKDIPLEFEYIYEGYKYTSDGKEITRSDAVCVQNYITKVYSYAGRDKVSIDVMVGYIQNGKIYDLKNIEIGVYGQDDLYNVLDKGTLQVYNFEATEDGYKLSSIGV